MNKKYIIILLVSLLVIIFGGILAFLFLADEKKSEEISEKTSSEIKSLVIDNNVLELEIDNDDSSKGLENNHSILGENLRIKALLVGYDLSSLSQSLGEASDDLANKDYDSYLASMHDLKKKIDDAADEYVVAHTEDFKKIEAAQEAHHPKLPFSYKLVNIRIVDDWAVGVISSEDENYDSGYAVYKRDSGSWDLYLGAGTDFDLSLLANNGMPEELTNGFYSFPTQPLIN